MPTHWIECCLCSEVFKLKEKYEKNLKKQTISKSSGFGFDINFGDTLYFIALMTYVTEIKDSNLAISIVNISETIPILFTIFFGIIADRTLNKVEMIIKRYGYGWFYIYWLLWL